jgi:hypothetical protein
MENMFSYGGEAHITLPAIRKERKSAKIVGGRQSRKTATNLLLFSCHQLCLTGK